MRDEILESIARTLFICAMADACEDPESPHYESSQRAGSGQDWFDTVTDDTPASAVQKAGEIAADFETRNKRAIQDACTEWRALEKPYARRDHDADSFGHYLAMQYLGHGVGLWDDTAARVDDRTLVGFETGYAEFGAWELD